MNQKLLTEMATDALRQAVRKVIEERTRNREPIAVWLDGRAVLIQPDQIKPSVSILSSPR
jgi:hypothetical protein